MVENDVLSEGAIASRIFLVRGRQVMLSHDLADLYGVPTKRLN
ncbi:MAG: ORF6N domain-containing protein, partial [Flavobacteriales bacterium]|nr:ORF6N domain-containing protein [Flavobacteriales bacterium]